MLRRVLFLCLACACAAAPAAAAQTRPDAPAQPDPPAGGYRSSQWRLEFVSATHIRFVGDVELELQDGVELFADEVNLHTDRQQLTAAGNVVFATSAGRISADRVEFDIRQGTGRFMQASGIISLGERAERVQFGGQDPDVYFYGDTVEKIGPRQYRITNGGFTTCVQPTPRWELSSGTVTLNLDDYALLTHTVLHVKGVPVFYLPVAYYPMQEDQRSTGFLLPTYGSSTLRGQAISNAFFWAINRSSDATFFHDWFTRTGQGYGSEYRYISGQQSQGNIRLYRFNQKAAAFGQGDEAGTLPEKKSFEVRANAAQAIAPGLRARARVDYFSDVITQQLYHQSLYDASRRMSVIHGGLTGAWGPYSTSLAWEQNEIFDDETSSTLYGSTPRLNAVVAPTRLFGAPVYGSVRGEFANLPYRRESDGAVTSDQGLQRIDVAPLVRVPVSRWTFLTLNTSVGYRLTRYSESLNQSGVQVPEPFSRSYLDLRADAVGPVFTKIWDAAPGGRAERYKHVIEPTFGYQQLTGIDDYRRTPILSSTSDFVVGGVARLTYGLTNRLLRRDRARDGGPGAAREFLSVGMQQTYYSDAEASRYDPAYASSILGRTPVDLSPVALTVRYSPAAAANATLRLEHDVSGGGVQSLSASGGVNVGGVSASADFSRRKFTERVEAQNFLIGNASSSFLDGRFAAAYNMSWDISRRTVVSQRISSTYFAQCCGFAVEFQNYNYGQFSSSVPIPADRRINFSFTLAGLGTFSNFFGAFGGNTR